MVEWRSSRRRTFAANVRINLASSVAILGRGVASCASVGGRTERVVKLRQFMTHEQLCGTQFRNLSWSGHHVIASLFDGDGKLVRRRWCAAESGGAGACSRADWLGGVADRAAKRVVHRSRSTLGEGATRVRDRYARCRAGLPRSAGAWRDGRRGLHRSGPAAGAHVVRLLRRDRARDSDTECRTGSRERVIDHSRKPGIHPYRRDEVLWSVVCGIRMSFEHLERMKIIVKDLNKKSMPHLKLYRASIVHGSYRLEVKDHPRLAAESQNA